MISVMMLFSYSLAYFQKRNEVQTIHLVVGELTYQLTGDLLNSQNQITINGGDQISFDLVMVNDNLLDTKYQLYYTSEWGENDFEIGYVSSTVDMPSGTILKGESKIITIGIINNTSASITITLGVRGGLNTHEVQDILLLSEEERIDQEIVMKDECEILEEAEPNAPVLASGMIPVTYDEGQESWIKADTSSTWYDYSNQMWANAVTVTETNRSTYINAPAGTPVSMDDINTMWVWIPRYSYTIRDTYGVQLEGGATPSKETPGAIDIKFISTTVKDNGSGTCTKCADNWVTPEGFTFGDEELSGFWIGKFETTGTMSAACTDENCTTADLTIKPNLTSVRNQNISSFFYGIRSMQNATSASKYGFDVIGTGTMDAHMAKNTEWGIVAMLSQSKYGKYGNPSYSGADKEVAINNCSNLITGIGGDTVSAGESTTTCVMNTYETAKGQAASTTGNIYGAYDMSGGATEYVMGNYNKISGVDTSLNSGFSGTLSNEENFTGSSWPDQKYYDLYTSSIPSTSYKAGDATYETFGWYADSADFCSSYSPWLHRGAYYYFKSSAGIFSSYKNGDGSANAHVSIRVVIKP